MANYSRTGPFTNSVTPPGISAAFLNAIENVLEQPVAGTETGKYILQGGAYTTGSFVCQYMSTLSRTSVPVSVTIDTADLAAVSFNAPNTNYLTANGFQLYDSSTGTSGNCHVGGNTTVTW